MSDPREHAEGIAQLVADGGTPDWDGALHSTTDPRERRVIESLRLLESVARVHRGDIPQSPAANPPGRTPATATERPAARWSRLELRGRLGDGGFGEVFRAWDPQLEREVALKLLRADETRASAMTSRVVEEGRLLARVRHANVVTVHGVELHDGRIGLWMELVRGRSLEQLLHEQGPFGAREAALIGIDLCRALAAVHRVGVVHRDIKAQNVMREEGGRILLMDFGAGLDLRGKGAEGMSVSGTPLYMAPELLREEPATRRSDIYGLGVLMYHLVTGSFPVHANSWEELCFLHMQRAGKLLRDERPDLPEGFVSVVERALAPEPESRFATAGQMEQALALAIGMGGGAAPVPSDAPPAPAVRGRRWIPATIAAVLIAVAAVTAWRAIAPRRTEPAIGQHGAGVAGRTEPDRTSSGTASNAAGVTEPYTVEAGVYRAAIGSSQRERLEPGSRLTLGDRLTVEYQSSIPMYVYVIDEDEAGHSYALFPLPGLDLQNPLPAGRMHVLPGARDGKELSWAVDSRGGREHLLMLASPTRLVEFEADMKGLARPGQIAVPIPDAARIHLRGLGSLAESPAPGAGATAGPLFEMAQHLAARSEMTRGVWVRQVELENPLP